MLKTKRTQIPRKCRFVSFFRWKKPIELKEHACEILEKVFLAILLPISAFIWSSGSLKETLSFRFWVNHWNSSLSSSSCADFYILLRLTLTLLYIEKICFIFLQVSYTVAWLIFRQMSLCFLAFCVFRIPHLPFGGW